MKAALLSVFLALPLVAHADCVWIPLCFAPQTTPIEAMRVYLDGVRVREIRPMWAPMGGRTNFWQCGGSGQRLSLTMVKGTTETAMVFGGDAEAVNPATCEGATLLMAPKLGSFYGPREQAMRAIEQLYSASPKAIDTDEDGTIRANDKQLLDAFARGSLPDYTDRICIASGGCP